jgi:hypothetical protein
MLHTPFNDRTNAFGQPTPPPSTRRFPAFNDQFTAANFFSTNENARETPATMEPPKKRRKLASDEPFGNKTDAEIWELPDEEIVGACAALRLVLPLNDILQRSNSLGAPPTLGSTITSPSSDMLVSSHLSFVVNTATPSTRKARASDPR